MNPSAVNQQPQLASASAMLNREGFNIAASKNGKGMNAPMAMPIPYAVNAAAAIISTPTQ